MNIKNALLMISMSLTLPLVGMEQLPQELNVQVVLHLIESAKDQKDVKDILSKAEVSKSWYELMQDPIIKKKIEELPVAGALTINKTKITYNDITLILVLYDERIPIEKRAAFNPDLKLFIEELKYWAHESNKRPEQAIEAIKYIEQKLDTQIPEWRLLFKLEPQLPKEKLIAATVAGMKKEPWIIPSVEKIFPKELLEQVMKSYESSK